MEMLISEESAMFVTAVLTAVRRDLLTAVQAPTQLVPQNGFQVLN